MFSKESLLKSATTCGLLEEENPHFIPETLGVLKNLADAASETIYEHPDDNGLSIQVIQNAFHYVFAKSVEIYFLWQAADGKDVTLLFSEADLLNGRTGASVPPNAADFMNTAMGMCTGMFNAFQEWLKTNQDLFQGGFLDLYDELNEALNWSARIGLSYAMTHFHGDR
ncbi:hypothetical protein SPSYN_02532 [Sporotomaculum syntrophicum]|uniref:Uncharacterized protein n=1 Tax=Sporotomaculum syntrophicum TaxID=182264 RepID=A0A9D3AXS2_9FIRM|nr:hypothetical protein [Sporotomaculum syntrophicum]KAF1084746.1 hypothetical protein SPSYN_02532 [Sporotomaculum syntrophicum]